MADEVKPMGEKKYTEEEIQALLSYWAIQFQDADHENGRKIILQLLEERNKLLARESKLVWLISDGKLSKPGYDMSVLESELDETIQKYAEKSFL